MLVHARSSARSSVAAATRSATMCTPMPGTVGHRDRAIGRDLDLRIDQVGREVAPAGGDVARQREVRQRRQVNVVRAADAALEHAAVPHRNAVRGRQIVQADRLAMTADPARLDVDDPAGAGVDRLLGERARVWIDSSRQIGVRIRCCSRAWSRMSS